MLNQLQSKCEPLRHRQWWLSWIGVLVGCTIMAAGFVYFINPYNIVPGGVYGLCIVLHSIFPEILIGTFGYMLDIPLMLISLVLLGAKLGGRTIVAALFMPTVMNILTQLSYPPEAIQTLDASMLLGGCIDLSNDLLLTSIVGGVLIGLGCGIVVKSQATTGGSEIVAMILYKYCHIRFSNGILLVDSLVVFIGLLVFGFGIGIDQSVTTPSVLLSFYSFIAIFVTAKVLDFVINGKKDDKILFVISERPINELRKFILEDLERTATLIKSEGLYTGTSKEMLFIVVSYKEVSEIKLKIKEADPTSFVVVTDAYDTFGEGWKTLPSAHEIQPE